MNLRILKKRCKRAVPILIERHGYKAEDFKPSDGSEAIAASASMERRFQKHGFLHPGPLRGTPLYWSKVSYEYDEWDAKLPCDVLDDIEFWTGMSEAEYAASIAPAE